MGIDKFYRHVVGVGKGEFRETLNCIKAALAISSTSNTPYSLLNPLGADLIIVKVVVDITTKCSASPVLMSVGIGAVSGAKYETLLDDAIISSPIAIGVYDNIDDQGSNGKATDKWGATEYLNVTMSASPTGVVANIYIWYRKA